MTSILRCQALTTLSLAKNKAGLYRLNQVFTLIMALKKAPYGAPEILCSDYRCFRDE